MVQEPIIIISKKQWEQLQNGERVKDIAIYREDTLHYELGDKPEEYIVRLRLTEIQKADKK